MKGIARQLGQGMTEYIIVVALVAIAAIGVYTAFGKTLRGQMAVTAQALAGNGADQARAEANEGGDDARRAGRPRSPAGQLRSGSLMTRRSHSGQALVVMLAFMGVLTGAFILVFNVGQTVNDKMKLVNAADAAAYSAALWEAQEPQLPGLPESGHCRQ